MLLAGSNFGVGKSSIRIMLIFKNLVNKKVGFEGTRLRIKIHEERTIEPSTVISDSQWKLDTASAIHHGSQGFE